MSNLQTLKKITTRRAKRLGRGIGSGVGGHTVGRGNKGQKARNSVGLWFEGGQLPLVKRLPMLRGKGRLKPLNVVHEIDLAQLQKMSASLVTLESLQQAGLVHRTAKLVKVLCRGKLTKAVTVQGIKVSQSAKAAIEAAGGSVE